MVNTWGVPRQVTALKVYSGVTVMVAVTGAFVMFVPVKEGIVLLVPLPANPILGVLLLQLYAVAIPLKVTNVVGDPLQTIWLDGAFTNGAGLTVIVNAWGVPVQLTPELV
jgi:hypothetical protein